MVQTAQTIGSLRICLAVQIGFLIWMARAPCRFCHSRNPGVLALGLGAVCPDRCENVRLRVSGDFDGVADIDETKATQIRKDGRDIVIEYLQPEESNEGLAVASFVLVGVSDAWQFGHKRVQFLNGSRQG